MEDVNKIREAALRDIDDNDNNEDWDEETKKNWEEKMNEPLSYSVVHKSNDKCNGNNKVSA